MDNSENKKAPEALTDEALDKVTGGDGSFGDFDAFFGLKYQCHACPRRDGTVKMLTIDYGDGSSSTQYLCPDCAARYGKTFKVY